MAAARSTGGNDALGEFLRARRAAVDHEALGLFDDGRARRVPGLRREELAALAHVSVDYVVRLEQGRARRVSSQVLDSLAEALGLTADEREHLFRIAGVALPAGPRALPPQVVPEQVEQLLAALHELPALVLGRRLDVLAWNPLAAALLVDFGALPPERRNLAVLTFLDPGYRALFGEQWEPMARECVEVLRMEAGQRPEDPAMARLVGELGAKDADFRRWWAGQGVRGARIRRKTYHHPLVGSLTLDAEQFAVGGRADQSLVTYTVPPGSGAAEALRFLALWTSSPAGGAADAREDGARRPQAGS
jgi:transcriptional regulator with XRE-family HTH domain